MVGTVLTVAGADFSANAIGYNTPNTRGLAGFFLEGVTGTQSAKNLILSGVPGLIVGSPTVASNYIEGSPGNSLNTGVADATGTFTVIVCCRHSVTPSGTTNYTTFAGTLTGTGSGSKGFMMAVQATGVLGAVFTVNGASSALANVLVASRGINLWEVIAFTYDPITAGLNIYNLTTGVQATPTAPSGFAYVPNGASPVLLASAPFVNGTTYPSPSDIAYAEIHNVNLSLSECQAIYTAMKPVLTARGIAA